MYKFTGFGTKANNAINFAVLSAEQLGHTYVGSEHLLLGLLREDGGVAAILLGQKGVAYGDLLAQVRETVGKGVLSALSPNDFTTHCKHILENALMEARLSGQTMAGTEHILLSAIHEQDSAAQRLLEQSCRDVAALERLLRGVLTTDLNQERSRPKPPKAPARPPARPGNLDKYGRDLTELARAGRLDPVIGRDKEIQRVIQILSRRTKNNPCLIGETGVGKTAIVEGLAQRVAQGTVPSQLRSCRVVSLDMTSMVAGTKYRGDFEERIRATIEEVIAAGDVILFIDELHTIMGIGAAEGAVDAANILKPQLARGELQLIGATTIGEFRRTIEKDGALERRFQSILVEEPSPDDAEGILRGLRERYERHHGVCITDEAIHSAVTLSRRYLTDRYLPDKAIDLIDEAASRLRLQLLEGTAGASRCVDRQAVAAVIAQATGIRVEQMEREEAEQCLDLCQQLHRTMVGQEDAVEKVARAIQRSRVGLGDPTRPVGSFLFLGPTGVGKTHLCRALGRSLFGDGDGVIKLDMSEYMEKHSVSKLIGAPPGYQGYEEGGQLTGRIRKKPNSVVLLDEVEKAHPDVMNLLLQLLEDGELTDSQGRKANFKNAVVIMTSNVGAQFITQQRSLGFSPAGGEEGPVPGYHREVMAQVKKTFTPELLNRIDEVVIFRRLTDGQLEEIAALLLDQVVERLAAMEIEMEYTPALAQAVAKAASGSPYGARPMRRALRELVEDPLAQRLLRQELGAGGAIRCDVLDGAMVILQAVRPRVVAERG